MRTPLILIGIILLFLVSAGASGAVNNTTDTVLAFYMVGSNMESGYGSATEDIAEMIAGYQGASPGTCDVVVGYGGSDKEGWHGMTIASITDLTADMKDGIIGNEGISQESYPDMNMGTGEALSTFLSYIKDTYPDSRKILVFWDHGGSYYGICFDENYDLDPLTLKELRQGLMDSRTTYDLIGMDACLMGSLEVASAIRDSAAYLLISEEVEPGHGWDYTPFVSALVLDPAISVPTLGKEVIDSYIDTADHEQMKKTLSLLDISRIDDVLTALNGFAGGLTPLIPKAGSGGEIGDSVRESQRFGYHPVEDVEVTIDLAGLADNINRNVDGAGSQTNALKTALDSFIVYARNDGSRPGSHGVSIISPRKIKVDTLPNLPGEVYLSDEWDLFLKSYIAYISSDIESPVIEKTDDGHYRVIDNLGSTDTKVSTRWLPEGPGSSSVLIKTKPAVINETGVIDPGLPDTTAFAIRDEKSGDESFLWTTSQGTEQDGRQFNHGVISIQRGNDIITSYLDVVTKSEGIGESLVYSLIPYQVRNEVTGDPRADILFLRTPVQFQEGDIVTTYAVDIKNEAGSSGFPYSLVPLGTVTINGPVQVIQDTLPGGETSILIVTEDPAANVASMEISKPPTPLSSLNPLEGVDTPDLAQPAVGPGAPVPEQRAVSFTGDTYMGLQLEDMVQSASVGGTAITRSACGAYGG